MPNRIEKRGEKECGQMVYIAQRETDNGTPVCRLLKVRIVISQKMISIIHGRKDMHKILLLSLLQNSNVCGLYLILTQRTVKPKRSS